MTIPPSDAELAVQPAELRGDYRFFLRLCMGLAKATLAGAAFLVWYLVAYVATGRAVSVGIFLLTTTFIAMILSLFAGLVAFLLFKSRGGQVIKNEPPPGIEPKRRHFSPPPEKP